MDTLSSSFPSHPPNKKPFSPNTELIKHRLLRKGVLPTPKILHTLRKKEIQKHNRRSNKPNNQEQTMPSDEDSLLREAAAEYRAFMGKPWKRLRDVDTAKIGRRAGGFSDERLDVGPLEELRKVFVERNGEMLRWFVDDADLEGFEKEGEESSVNGVEGMSDDEKIQLLARRYVAFALEFSIFHELHQSFTKRES